MTIRIKIPNNRGAIPDQEGGKLLNRYRRAYQDPRDKRLTLSGLSKKPDSLNRRPTDYDMNQAMTEQVSQYWYNIPTDITAGATYMPAEDSNSPERIITPEIGAEGLNVKYEPNTGTRQKKGTRKEITPGIYADMLGLEGYTTSEGMESIKRLAESLGITPNRVSKANGYWEDKYLFRFEDIKGLELVNEFGYEDLGQAKRQYQSPLDMTNDAGELDIYAGEHKTLDKWYNVNQHVYVSFKRANPKEVGRHIKLSIEFNPNRFVLDKGMMDYEPVLVFIDQYVMPWISGEPWITLLHVNCDLMGQPDRMRLEVDKKHLRRVQTVNSTTYVTLFNKTKLERYNKTDEKLYNVRTSKDSYMHSEELTRAKKVFGSDMVRLELKLDISGLVRVIKAYDNPRHPAKLLPEWLDVVYRPLHGDGTRKARKYKRTLENAYKHVYEDVLKGLPFVTPEVIQATLEKS